MTARTEALRELIMIYEEIFALVRFKIKVNNIYKMQKGSQIKLLSWNSLIFFFKLWPQPLRITEHFVPRPINSLFSEIHCFLSGRKTVN